MSSTSKPTSSETNEVMPQTPKRYFSAANKLRILLAADACSESGQIAALLRTEGIYSSHLSDWRKARGKGQLLGLSSQPRGPKPPTDLQAQQRIVELERELHSWKTRAEKAEFLVDLQKKVSALLQNITLDHTEKQS